MGNKLTSIFNHLFQAKEEENPKADPISRINSHDSIISKLRKINQSLEVSRELLMGEMAHYSDEQKKGLCEHIEKDILKTGDHINTMMKSLLQYMDILKKRLYQHHLFSNEAYHYGKELYQLAFQACLWIPKSDALINQSKQQFLERGQKIKSLLEVINLVLLEHKAKPELIRANKNHEWLLERQSEIEDNIQDHKKAGAKKEDLSQLEMIKGKLLSVDLISDQIQHTDYALLDAIYRNGRRFYETLYVQNTLNCLRSEMKMHLEAKT